MVGRPDAALDAFLQAGAWMQSLGASNPAVVPWRSGAALALARLGRPTDALRLVEAELDAARRFGAPRPLAATLRIAAAVGDRGEAVPRLRIALDSLAGSPATLERARVLLELGAALRRSGQRLESVECLREGQELADRCDARLLSDRARKEIEVAGGRPRRGGQRAPNELTPSEHRVVEMALKGLTNREIAQALFVTVKAVEWHLGNAYGKLGISSRRELRTVPEGRDLGAAAGVL